MINGIQVSLTRDRLCQWLIFTKNYKLKDWYILADLIEKLSFVSYTVSQVKHSNKKKLHSNQYQLSDLDQKTIPYIRNIQHLFC